MPAKLSTLVVTLLLLSSSVLAQPRQEFMKLYNPKASTVKMNYMYAPDLESDVGSVTEFDQHVFDIDLRIPIPMSQRFIFMLGAGYGLRFYDYSQTPTGSVLEQDVEELHRLSLTPGAVYFMNRDTALMIDGEIGAYSNGEDGFKSDDLRYLGKAFLVHHWKTNVQLILGVAKTDDFADNEVIPLLGLRTFQGPWHLSVTLPLEAVASYRWNKELSMYIGGWISGSDYEARSESVDDFTVHVRDTRVGAGLDYWIMPDVYFTFEAGALLGNDAFAVDLVGTEEDDLRSAGYARAGIGLHLN